MQESLKLDMRKRDFQRLTAAWVVAAICAAAVIMPAPVQAQQSGGWRQEVAEKAQAAQQAGQKGNYSEAIRLLKEAKSKGTLQPAEEQGVNELLIWAASSARDYGLLAATIEERLATGRVRGADQVNKLKTLADAYYSARDLRRASDATNRLIKARGTATADDLILLGQLQFQLKDFRAAAPTLEKAYQAARRAGKATRTQVQVLEMLNASYFELKDEGNRMETLHQLMVVQPKMIVFDQIVGQYQREGYDAVGMVNLYRLGLRANVLSKEHYGRYADAALDVSSPGEAVTMLEKGMATGAIKKDNRNERLLADAKQQVASLKANLSQQEREARAIADGDADARLAAAYYTLGDWAKTLEVGKRALQKGRLDRPDQVHMLLGVTLMHLKKSAEAKTSFDAAAKANSNIKGVANLWSDVAGG